MDPKDRGYTREGHYTAASYLPILHLVSHTVDIAKAHANAFKVEFIMIYFLNLTLVLKNRMYFCACISLTGSANDSLG